MIPRLVGWPLSPSPLPCASAGVAPEGKEGVEEGLSDCVDHCGRSEGELEADGIVAASFFASSSPTRVAVTDCDAVLVSFVARRVGALGVRLLLARDVAFTPDSSLNATTALFTDDDDVGCFTARGDPFCFRFAGAATNGVGDAIPCTALNETDRRESVMGEDDVNVVP